MGIQTAIFNDVVNDGWGRRDREESYSAYMNIEEQRARMQPYSPTAERERIDRKYNSLPRCPR